VTLFKIAAAAARVLETAGLAADDSRRDAALLARARLGWDTARWLAHAGDPAPPGFEQAFAAAIERRRRREPIAYIIGEREFYGRTFAVSPAVLIPRPETERLVDEALALLRSSATSTVVDAGTGSGCLAVTVALECTSVRVIATDTSEAALEIARANARRLGAPSIEFIAGDWLDGVSAPIDVIVANPPYVPESSKASLMPELGYEPRTALFGGPDGLDAIRSLVGQASQSLAPGGTLLMEIGAGQGPEVTRLIAATGRFERVRLAADLQSIPRVAIAHVPLLPHHRR
jgi:release factor glutamine methyltransferase